MQQCTTNTTWRERSCRSSALMRNSESDVKRARTTSGAGEMHFKIYADDLLVACLCGSYRAGDAKPNQHQNRPVRDETTRYQEEPGFSLSAGFQNRSPTSASLTTRGAATQRGGKTNVMEISRKRNTFECLCVFAPFSE